PEVIPTANVIGSCALKAPHLVGPFESDFSFVNNSDHTVRVYRVDNVTGELSENFGFTTLAKGDTYDSASTWKWFGNRRAAITDESGNCAGVAVMTEKDTSNDYEITNALFGTDPVVITGDMDGDGDVDRNDIRAFAMAIRRGEELHLSFDLNNDGVINSRDVRAMKNICSYDRCRATPAQ
ncbi:MAG: hypothetical protein HRT50_04705, partial [Colwellia sp.]|nr:hypothetical protein [Colwellia sp.]